MPQRKSPQIWSNQKRYKVGDMVTLTCVSDFSQPRPTIDWLINGQAVLQDYLFEPNITLADDNTTTTSIIKFKLRNEHLIDGEHFSVQCRSYLAHHFAPESMYAHLFCLCTNLKTKLMLILINSCKLTKRQD